jgi:hypothetical protein
MGRVQSSGPTRQGCVPSIDLQGDGENIDMTGSRNWIGTTMIWVRTFLVVWALRPDATLMY